MLRLITILSILAVAAAPSFAQDVMFFNKQMVGGGMHFPVPVPPEESITAAKAALNLSEAQVTGLRALLTQRGEASRSALQELGQKQTALHTLLNQQNPSALDIGNAYLAVQSAQNGLKAAEQKFQTDFRALLTPEQRVTLQNLQNASEQIDALRMLGIFNMEPRTFGPMPAIGPLGIGPEHSIRIFRRNEQPPR